MTFPGLYVTFIHRKVLMMEGCRGKAGTLRPFRVHVRSILATRCQVQQDVLVFGLKFKSDAGTCTLTGTQRGIHRSGSALFQASV
jgi:hypothetical protein